MREDAVHLPLPALGPTDVRSGRPPEWARPGVQLLSLIRHRY